MIQICNTKDVTDIGFRVYIDAPILRAGLVISDLPGENLSGRALFFIADSPRAS